MSETSSQKNEFISIVIPAYNAAPWIDRCLESVLAAADADCEIIIVDDGSTDDTLQHIRHYEDADPRIMVVHTDNQGVGAARKTGVENAQGDSIIFVDSDDELTPDSIAELRAAGNADIVVGNISKIDVDGTAELSLAGRNAEISGTEYCRRILTGELDNLLLGKKISRHLFEAYYWDTHTIFAGLYQRAMLLSAASAAKTVILAPGAHVYKYMCREWSMSALLQLRTEGVDRLWQNVSRLPLPKPELLRWGLNMLEETLLSRGVPFRNDLTPVVDLKVLAQQYGDILNDDEKRILALLRSPKARLRAAQIGARTLPMTMAAPHLSFVIHGPANLHRARRTIESILDTGFRNIEIVLVIYADEAGSYYELNSKYRRLVLRKHPEELPRSMGWLTGLQNSRGYAVTFLHPGDTVSGPGILEALRHVDMGSDVAFMGMEESYHGVKVNSFDPTTCTVIHDGANATYDNLLGRGVIVEALKGFIVRTDFIKNGKFPIVDLPHGAEIPTILAGLAKKPRLSATSLTAVRRVARGYNIPLKQRLQNVVKLGTIIIENEAGDNVDEYIATGRRRRVGEGGAQFLAANLAAEYAVPVFGAIRVRRMAKKIVADPEIQSFFRLAGVEMPTASTLQKRAHELFLRNSAKIRKRRLLSF